MKKRELSLSQKKRLIAVARQFKTPLYVYEEEKIRKQYRRLKKSLPEEVTTLYAVKANPSLAICQLFRKEGVGADVASEGEMRIALKAGISPKHMVFTGPGKTYSELSFALRRRIFLIVLESLNEARKVNEIAKKINFKQKVLLRINVNFFEKGGEIKMGGGSKKFGVDEEKAPAIIEKILRLNNLNFLGIHAFPISQVLNYKAFIKSNAYVLRLADSIRENGAPIKIVDFGGGLGVSYSPEQKDFNLKSFGREMKKLLKRQRNDYHYILEIGRFLVAEAGYYVVKVIDIKESRGKKFLIIDGGTHHLLRQFYKEPNKFFEPLLSREDSQQKVTIGGPLCTPSDILIEDAETSVVKLGDLIAFRNCGAYAASSGTIFFNCHPCFAEVLLIDGKAELIRERGSPKDYLRGQISLDV